MKKNYLLLNFIVLLFSMTFGGYALQPTAADVYTPSVTDDEVSVFLETSSSQANIWAWNESHKNLTTAANYPGEALTLMGQTPSGKNIFRWTFTDASTKGMPTKIIFNKGDGNDNKIGGESIFKNHGYYVEGNYDRTIEPKKTTFTLLSNEAEVSTNTKGSFVMDLTSATAADATIMFTIDDVVYGLATAQTISAAGTTNVDFVANATAALTLTKGFIYYLSVKKDGKMTVVAKEKGVADGNYYLVGNFFEEDLDKINYDKKYFRFTNSKGDGTLTFDIPASLEIKAQVYASDGTCYGPVDGGTGYGISNTHPKAAAKSVNGDLVAGSNYWTFSPRGLAETGIYTITITVDAAGTPTKWDVTYDNSKRMAYFLVDPTKDPDAVVHPTYAVVNADRSCSNNFYGNIHMDADDNCFVVGNIKQESDDNIVGHPLKTTSKLYLQGNGGLDPTMTVPDADRDKYTKLYPNKTPGFSYNETKTMVLEYNPSKGHNTVANESGNHGIGGEILKASSQITDDPITSVQIVGDGVVGSWELSAAKNMTYNKKLDCWEYTFRTEKPESADNKFRFIANGDWKYNWGEESYIHNGKKIIVK